MDRPEGFSAASAKRTPGARSRRPPGRKTTPVQSQATKRRKRAQKEEYRSLTLATSRRRRVWGVSMGSIGALLIAVTIVTLSPLLALQNVQVEGSKRLDASEIQDALAGLYGEPLARVSPEHIAKALEPLTLIQAFTTRIELPHTLVVSVVERTPIGVVSAPGGFAVLDAAGVVLWSEVDQPEDLPLLSSSPERNPAGFEAVTRALVALPPDIVGQIESISATTLDNVRFTMRSSDHRVVWGSSDRAREKAKVLAASLIAAGSATPKLIDVSTPESVVIRDQE